MPRVYLGIGSNIERERNIRAAVRALKAAYPDMATSPVYESKAEGFDGADFYNLAATFETDEPLERLIERLTLIESAQGRVRTGRRFDSRTLDIDVLLYGDLVRHDGRIDLPRRDILEYAHVLGPLLALAPKLQHPETGEPLARRWREVGAREHLREVPLDLDTDDTAGPDLPG